MAEARQLNDLGHNPPFGLLYNLETSGFHSIIYIYIGLIIFFLGRHSDHINLFCFVLLFRTMSTITLNPIVDCVHEFYPCCCEMSCI